MTDRPSALLDASVLIPAVLCDLLLRAAVADLFTPYWTDEILEEARRNLVSDLSIPEAKARDRIAAMRETFPGALVTDYSSRIELMTNQPKDRHVLAAAVTAKAEVIVTSNLRDFRAKDLEGHGVVARSPDAFLTRLFAGHAEGIVDVIHRQAAALRRPPMSIDEVLDQVARQAPRFAAAVRHRLTAAR